MRGGREAKHLPAVVVGVDASTGSREALQWAIAEARLREVPLRAAHAWTYAQPLIPSLIGYPYSAEYVDSTNDERQQAAERLLEHVTFAYAETHEIEIERVTAEGQLLGADRRRWRPLRPRPPGQPKQRPPDLLEGASVAAPEEALCRAGAIGDDEG